MIVEIDNYLNVQGGSSPRFRPIHYYDFKHVSFEKFSSWICIFLQLVGSNSTVELMIFRNVALVVYSTAIYKISEMMISLISLPKPTKLANSSRSVFAIYSTYRGKCSRTCSLSWSQSYQTI